MYALNNESAQAARKAEQRTSFIDEKGKYVGKFTRAEDITAASGTRGIAFTFETFDGQKSNFSIYTIKKDGEKLGDYGTLMAIMTCLGIKDIKPAQAASMVWDREQGANVNKMLTQFPELLNKPIGVLFAMEEYAKKQNGVETGETGWSVRLNAVFQADTELTAAEILDRKTVPAKLPLLVAALRDRPLKKAVSRGASAGSSHPMEGGGFDDMDDSIPF
jgi:hypothetical protein